MKFTSFKDGETKVTFRADQAMLDRLEEARQALAERNPGMLPTRSDAVRFIIATGSTSAIAAAEPVRKNGA